MMAPPSRKSERRCHHESFFPFLSSPFSHVSARFHPAPCRVVVTVVSRVRGLFSSVVSVVVRFVVSVPVVASRGSGGVAGVSGVSRGSFGVAGGGSVALGSVFFFDDDSSGEFLERMKSNRVGPRCRKQQFHALGTTQFRAVGTKQFRAVRSSSSALYKNRLACKI